MKKISAILLALIMMLSMVAFAQEVAYTGDDAGNGSITISNASKGETYAVYKLFDATVSADGKINYTTTAIPTELASYFTGDSLNSAIVNIKATDAAIKAGTTDTVSDELRAALTTWAGTQTALKSAESDGSALTFKALPYGYYVVTTSQGQQLISVDSTNPTATIIDKNSTTTTLTKAVNDNDVNIDQTVEYTVNFTTSNYNGATQITSYTIHDTLPTFLSDVVVTSITIDGEAYTVDGENEDGEAIQVVPQFSEAGQIVIPWAEDGANLYDNGATVIVKYTAKVTQQAAIAGEGNTNTVTVTPSSGDEMEAEVTIKTYAFVLKKVNEAGQDLAGATFQLPFNVVVANGEEDTYYKAETGVNTVTTDASGLIVIKGVATGDYEITETVAPNGYNKLTSSFTVTVGASNATSTDVTYIIDDGAATLVTEENQPADDAVTVEYENTSIYADSAVVVNVAGSELPSTGGIGTTIFYTVGGLMMAAAIVLLVAKKKVAASK